MLAGIVKIWYDPLFEEASSEDRVMLVLYAQQKMTLQQKQKAHTMSQGQLKFKMKEEHLKFVTDQQKLLEIRVILVHSLQYLLKW
jgi:hypothetical protein